MTQPPEATRVEPGAPDESSRAPRRWVKLLFRVSGLAVLAVTLFGMTAWATLAVYFADLSGGATPRRFTALAFALAAIAAIIFIKPRRFGVAVLVGMFVVVLTWFLLLKPSNTRDWSPDVAELPTARIEGDMLTIRNVRNFDYRSATDYTPRWEDRVYDLSKIQTADLILVYWGSKAIAHAMVSFEFEGGEHLAVSIETRKERTESYSAVQGFFRQYELYYVFADERDVIRVRTEFRNEDVYIYRTTINPSHARELLLSYTRRANALAERPRFYNALTSNCATNVVAHIRDSNPSALARVSWEVLLSGYAARPAYRNGRLDTSLPFEELEKRSHVNAVVHTTPADAGFAAAIRRGLPSPPRARDK